MNRHIIHLDLDTFFVSCERLLDRRLNDIPVLIGGISNRGVVAACSYETREYGIHSGMPMRMARTLCPDATVIRGKKTKAVVVPYHLRSEAPPFARAVLPDQLYPAVKPSELPAETADRVPAQDVFRQRRLHPPPAR